MSDLVLGVGADCNKCLMTERLLGLDLLPILSKGGQDKKGGGQKHKMQWGGGGQT